MGNHHRTGNDDVVFEIDPEAASGRHRTPSAGPGAGVKAGVVAAATGALLVGAGQMGAGTAAAAPATQTIAGFEIPQGLLPEGVVVPAELAALPALDIPELPDFAADLNTQAQQFLAGINPGTTARTVQPVSGTLTSTFGSRWGAHHGGLDIAAPIGPRSSLQPTARSSTPARRQVSASGFASSTTTVRSPRTATSTTTRSTSASASTPASRSPPSVTVASPPARTCTSRSPRTAQRSIRQHGCRLVASLSPGWTTLKKTSCRTAVAPGNSSWSHRSSRLSVTPAG